MDDIRPPRGSTGPAPTGFNKTPGVDSQAGLSTTVASSSYPSEKAPEVAHSSDEYSLNVSKKSGKKLKVLLVISIIVAVTACAFAAWQYMQMNDLQQQVDELQKENQRLNERVYSLNYDNRDLNRKVELLTTENDSLQELNKKLVETCGNACSTIIP